MAEQCVPWRLGCPWAAVWELCRTVPGALLPLAGLQEAAAGWRKLPHPGRAGHTAGIPILWFPEARTGVSHLSQGEPPPAQG